MKLDCTNGSKKLVVLDVELRVLLKRRREGGAGVKSLAVCNIADGRMRAQRGKGSNRGASADSRGNRVIHWNGSRIQAEGRSDMRVEVHGGDRAESRIAFRQSARAAQRAQNIRFGQPRHVPLDDDGQIVLQRQVDRVLQADVQLAVLDHLLDARRIHQHRFGNRRGT